MRQGAVHASVFVSPSPSMALRERGIKGVRVPPSPFLKQSNPCLKSQNNQNPAPLPCPQRHTKFPLIPLVVIQSNQLRVQSTFNHPSINFNPPSIIAHPNPLTPYPPSAPPGASQSLSPLLHHRGSSGPPSGHQGHPGRSGKSAPALRPWRRRPPREPDPSSPP